MSVEVKRLKLVNFQGIYTALGMKEFEFDRYNSNNNVILILGENGSGKTTILNEITPIPLEHVGFRNKSRIIPDTVGVKEIDLLLDEAILYKCKIVYDTKKKTTNCFVNKVMGIDEFELNPNGNVASYLEVLERELGFNKKYMTVGYLSRSLTDFVSMKATERNDYITDWLPNIAEFYDGYKLTTKLINKAKRDIDNYNKDIGKISSINYKLELNQLEANISFHNTELDNIKNNITKLDVYKQQIRENYIPRGEFIIRINKFKRNRDILNKKYDFLLNEHRKLAEFEIDVSDPSSVQKGLQKIEYEQKMCNTDLENCEKRLFELKTEIDSYNNTISKTKDKTSNTDLKTVLRNIEELNMEYQHFKNVFEGFDNKFLSDSDINEIDITLMKQLIDQFEDQFVRINNIIETDKIKSVEVIEKTITEETDNLENVRKIYDSNMEKMVGINKEIYKYQNNDLNEKLLSERPMFCMNKACSIIEELKKYIYPEETCKKLREELHVLETETATIKSSINDAVEYISNLNKSIGYMQDIDNLLYKQSELIGRFPNEISDALSKTPLEIYINLNQIKMDVKDLSEFNSVNVKLTDLKVAIENLTNLKFVISTKDEVSEKLNKCLLEYDSLLTDKQNYFKRYQELGFEYDKLNNIEEYLLDFNKNVNKYNSDILLMKQEKIDLNIYNKHIYYFNVIEDQLYKLNSDKLRLETELININKRRDEINTNYISKTQLEKMRDDLQSEFNKMTILNKVFSPKIGYPSLLITDFLNNLTIETNRDLKKMWGESSLKIEEFRLGASEFSILVNREGTILDDVSLCSDGERSCFGLAISFAIIEMNIRERGYNVLRLDEIDGMLDDNRRRGFMNVMKNRLDDLDVKSCFMISHNNEFDDTEADVILLKGYRSKDTNMGNKNVIFKV